MTAMPVRLDILSFRHENDEPFRLEARYHSDNPELKHRTLFRFGKKIKAENRALELLAYLLQNPLVVLDEDDIALRIWGDDVDGSGNVEQQIYRLRSVLGDDHKAPRYIETLRGEGYKFLKKPVVEKGQEKSPTIDRRRLRLVEHWEDETFIQFLKKTTRGKEADEEGDLRILTTAFSSGVPDSLADLLEQDVRVRILLVNETLMRARNKVRADGHTPDKALKRLREQRDTLNAMMKRSKPGILDVRETDVMPCGFVAHNQQGALLGLFLATESYARGPMIQIAPDTKLWEILCADWKALWKDAGRKVKTKKRTRR